MNKGPNVSPVVAASIICLAVGGAIGFFTKSFLPSNDYDARRTVTGPPGGMVGGGPPGGMGGMMGGGGGGGQQNAGGLALARLVGNINTIETAQGKGLKPEQKKALLPILQKIRSSDKISADDADKDTAAIRQILDDTQKQTLDAMQPARGGFGGGGGGGGRGGGGGAPGGPGGGPAGAPPGTAVAANTSGGPGVAAPPGGAPAGGPPAGMMGGGPPGGMGGMMGGGGMGGGRPDPERPFANERNQRALGSLINEVSK